MSEPGFPTRVEALRFLEKAGCSPSVIEHCKDVSAFAVKLAKACQGRGLKVDVPLVEISGLLHDVGRSKTHSVDHALVGGEIARSFGLPKKVVLAIERHAGGGIPKDEAVKLGWPHRDFLPKTLEEKIVCYADKRVEGMHLVSMEQVIKMYASSLGENHPAIKRIWQLHNEITGLIGNLDADCNAP